MRDLIRELDTFDAFRTLVEDLGRERDVRLCLEATWTTGGMSGGSCWGDDANYPVDAEPEPDDTTVDTILERVAPSLTFLQYRKLMRADLYERTNGVQNEYYGNYTTWTRRTLKLRTFYAALREITA
jgi:hypothetical protein